jgi:heme exporter protein CcmD
MAGFFAMGGYGVFVWPAYIASVLVLGCAIVVSLAAHARARHSVRRLEEDGGENGDQR